jgi:hypothetical protein
MEPLQTDWGRRRKLMKRSSKPAVRVLAGALALVMVFVFAAPPAGAAEGTAEAPIPKSDTSLAEQPTLLAMADAKVQAADPADAIAPAQTSEVAAGRSFIKTPEGIAAVILVAVGTALVFAKRETDRTTSPVR